MDREIVTRILLVAGTMVAESEAEKLSKSVKWLKDGKVVTERELSKIQKFGTKLRVNNVQTEDNGVYQCFVTLASGLQIQSAGELRLGGDTSKLRRRPSFKKVKS